jgi:hypothetical protein
LKKHKPKSKKHQRRRARRELSKKRKRTHLGLSQYKKDAIWRSYNKKQPRFFELKSPKTLSLRSEFANEFLQFINEIKRIGNKGFFIRLNLKEVSHIGEGGIAMLLSVISDLERKGIFFDGYKPDKLESRDVLERSGFFKHMNGTVSKKNQVSKNEILKTGDGKTDQTALIPHIHKAMETIWGEERRCPALYSGLGEMMRNSIEHAFEKEQKIIWHLGLTHIEEDNSVKFTFVDNGDGIINTYRNRENATFSRIREILKNNAEILKAAFENGIQSRTGLPWRGKGLPTIFELYQDQVISNLVVISNNAYLDYDRNLFIKLRVNYSGTFYYWVMNRDCSQASFPIGD